MQLLRKKYAVVIIVGFCFIATGALPFLFEKKHITSGELVQYHPYCVVLIAIGVYLFCSCVRSIRGVSNFSRK